MRYVIGPGSPFWYESATKINATLPGVPAATGVIVFVSDGNRMDSNAQFVTVLSR